MAAREQAGDEERRARRDFAVSQGEDRYRPWQRDLYVSWEGWNARHFQGRLKPPHLGFGRTPPRSLGICSILTDYGARCQSLLNARLVFGDDPLWVAEPGGRGHRRAVEDLFLRLTVQQYVIEVLGGDERRYYGCGPLFLAEANRVGLSMGLGQVVFDRSGPADAGLPICKGWPHNVRPEDWYSPGITQALLHRLTHPAKERAPAGIAPPTLGMWELVLFLQAAGRHEDVRSIASAQVDRLRSWQASWPVLRKFEEGDEDEDGAPIKHAVEFDPAWTAWNGGTVRNIALGIHAFRQYAELPILADALEEAGCDDGVILRHLRARNKGHDCRCWVLKALLPDQRQPPAALPLPEA